MTIRAMVSSYAFSTFHCTDPTDLHGASFRTKQRDDLSIRLVGTDVADGYDEIPLNGETISNLFWRLKHHP